MATRKLPKIDIKQVYFDLDQLWWDTVNDRDTAGPDAHERLFGKEGVFPMLDEAGKLREAYMTQLPGTIYAMADFAVSSGHEAVSFFAGRVSGYARIRRRPLQEIPQEVARAEAAHDLRAKNTADLRYMNASEEFAKAIKSALTGWREHNAWIYRSLFQELMQAGETSDANLMVSQHRDRATRRVQRGGLPWKIMFAIQKAGGVMMRGALLDAVAPTSDADHKSRRAQIGNYLSPKGPLVGENLVTVSRGIVTLTVGGVEALPPAPSQ